MITFNPGPPDSNEKPNLLHTMVHLSMPFVLRVFIRDSVVHPVSRFLKQFYMVTAPPLVKSNVLMASAGINNIIFK